MKTVNALDFASLQDAINACDEKELTLLKLEAGNYECKALELHSNLILNLDEGATISFSSDPHDYPPVFTRWEGVECYCMHPLIFAKDCHDITIQGKGVIDGCGQAWWDTFRTIEAEDRTKPREDYELNLAKLNPDYDKRPGGGARPSTQFLRPPLMQFLRCQNILMKDVLVRNSPFWTLHFVYSSHIELNGVKVNNPADAINTDALDLDSCTHAYIHDCVFDVGDDAITLKSGSGADGLRVNKPTTDVKVRNCTIYASHGGIAIGSETAAGIKGVDVADCTFKGTQRAIRLKSRRGRGGVIEDIKLRNLTMDHCWCPIVIGQYFAPGLLPHEKDYALSEELQPVTDMTPRIRNIHISNVNATNVRSTAAFIVGLPEAPIENITIENFKHSLAPEAELLETWNTEPTDGHFHDSNRDIKIINAHHVTIS